MKLPRILAIFLVTNLQSPLQAHHGPPHDEIDEFDSPALQQSITLSTPLKAWLALGAVSMLYLAFRHFSVKNQSPSHS